MGKKRRIAPKRRQGTRNAVIVGVVVLAIVIIGAVAYSFRNTASTSTTTSSDPRLAYLTLSPYYSSFPVLGSKNASVAIFEFGDFQCPSCDYWYKNYEQTIIQNLVDTGKAKIIWRDFIIYGPYSVNASKAAYAAGEQGKFWQYHDLLYTNQGQVRSGWASVPNLMNWAKSLNLNMAQFTTAYNSGSFDNLISNNYNAGQQLGVSGTPTFILVGPHGQIQEIDGPQPASVFESTVDSLIAGG